ncbi:MAG: response regulator, partial [Bacteroidales bacterium]|nr:response regulator [Bacteroidales bacterium]
MSKSLNLLIIEDSEIDALIIVKALKQGGYVPKWERVDTEKEMRAALEKQEWDLIISDYSMPDFNGLEALKIFKEYNIDIPFILISGVIEEEFAVDAMVSGAHDYIMKDKLFKLLPTVERELRDAKIRRDQKKTAQALKESEQELTAIFNGARDGIALLDKTGKILRINKYIVEIGGYAEEEFVGKRFSALKMFSLKNMSKMITIFGKLIKGQKISYEV